MKNRVKLAAAVLGVVFLTAFWADIRDEVFLPELRFMILCVDSYACFLIQVITSFGNGLSGKARILCTALSTVPIALAVSLSGIAGNRGSSFFLMVLFLLTEFVLCIVYYKRK